MEWLIPLAIILGGLLVLLVTGMPIMLAFVIVIMASAYVLWGGNIGIMQYPLHIVETLGSFNWFPVPLFILMGEMMFESGMAYSMIDAIDKWLGRLPGRLSLLTVASGVLLGALTGVPMASVALLGTTVLPEMEKRGYKKPMTMGPILGAGGLAMLIPPSAIAVLLGALADISVGKVLIGGIIPALILAAIFSVYIIVRCRLNPALAPSYELAPAPLRKKIESVIKHILPLGIVIFMVIGVMILGLGTPSEAAATGAFGCFILAYFYKQLNWAMFKKILINTTRLSVMVFMIIAGSTAFSQMLAFSGATKRLVEIAASLNLSPIVYVLAMNVVVLILGCFMELVSIMMITFPIFFPSSMLYI